VIKNKDHTLYTLLLIKQILKLKSTLFSLKVIAMLNVLLTSCEKETITPVEETLMVEEKTIPPVTTNLSEDVNLRSFNKPCFVNFATAPI